MVLLRERNFLLTRSPIVPGNNFLKNPVFAAACLLLGLWSYILNDGMK